MAAAMAGNLVLYSFPLAYNPAKARLAMVEKGVAATVKNVHLFNGESLSPSYMKINPNASAPTLVAGDKVITESADIVRYFDSLGDGPLGGAAVDKALVSEWIKEADMFDGNLFFAAFGPDSISKVLGPLQQYKMKVAEAEAQRHPELADAYNKKIQSMKAAGAESSDAAKVEANQQVLLGLLDKAETQLGKTKFLAGDAYSMADVVMTPALFRIHTVKKDTELIGPRPKVGEWYGRVKQRPSFKEVFGPAESPLTAAKLLVPSLIKAKLANLFGRY